MLGSGTGWDSQGSWRQPRGGGMENHTRSRVSLLPLEKDRLCESDLSLGGVLLPPLSMLSLK